VHNGPREPAFADRFAAHPESIDAIMFQHWGTRGEQDGWLAAGIEEQIRDSLAGWPGSAVFAEYGYEHNPELPLLIPSHHYCDGEHTWRGAWRGAFCALGIIHGFDNSWGPFQVLDQDQPGLIYLLHLRRFFTEIVPFHRMRPAPEAIVPEEHSSGQVPLALATPEGDVVAVYLPVGGIARLSLPVEGDYCARRYDPRSGELLPASVLANVTTGNFAAPGSEDGTGHPWDWVLLLTARRVCG
jgi:hypothetical protein